MIYEFIKNHESKFISRIAKSFNFVNEKLCLKI